MAYIKKVKRPNGKTNIYIAEKNNSKTIVLEKLGILNKEVSMSQAKIILARHLERRQPLVADLTLSMLLDEFVPYYKNEIGKTISQRTFDSFFWMASKKFEWLKHKRLKDIQEEEIEDFQDTLNTFNNRSINIAGIELKKVLRYALKKHYISRLPDIRRLKEGTKDPIRICREQLTRILDATEGNTNFYISFMVSTGLRPYEFRTLKWDDICFKTKSLEIKSNNDKKLGRSLPLTQVVIDRLAERKKQGGNPCPYVSASACRDAVFRAGNKIGFTWKGKRVNLCPLYLRKTYGSMMAENGVSVFMLCKFMGHKSILTTNDFYIGIEVEQLRNELELHPLHISS